MNLQAWAMRMILWDGVLPLVVWGAPFVIAMIFPNVRGAIEIASIIIPITALIVRFNSGRQFIHSNNCLPLTQTVQVALLTVGILLLLLVDCFLILSHLGPGGNLVMTPEDFQICVFLFLTYFALIGIAMYPGRDRQSDCSSAPINDG